jgi:hypothetical protein
LQGGEEAAKRHGVVWDGQENKQYNPIGGELPASLGDLPPQVVTCQLQEQILQGG